MSGLLMKFHQNKKIRAQEKDKQVAYVQRATFPEAMSTEYLHLMTTNHQNREKALHGGQGWAKYEEFETGRQPTYGFR